MFLSFCESLNLFWSKFKNVIMLAHLLSLYSSGTSSLKVPLLLVSTCYIFILGALIIFKHVHFKERFWKLAPFECNRRFFQVWTLTFVSHIAQRRPPVAEWDMNVYLGAWCRLILWGHFTLYYRPKDYSVYRIYWYTWQGLMFIQSYSCFVQSVFLRRYFPCILEILS